jgi:hypothetical protein
VEALDERTLMGACGLYCGLCPPLPRVSPGRYAFLLQCLPLLRN